MNTGTFIALQALAICIVVAQPVFGWQAIPKFFNYSMASSVIFGILDAAILMFPAAIYMRSLD